ncbi:MAG TPA: NUDIX hydrolase [Bacillota bacterium]|nr:NUDIX hydrolase [Bacillota bacterium]
MTDFFRLLGMLTYWCAWPVFWVYFKRSYGRSRILLINPAGEILLMQQWISSGKWHLPGGGLHRDEEGAMGALRELREETGVVLTPANLITLGKQTCKAHGFTYDAYIFAAHVGNDVRLERQRIEVARMAWMKPETLSVAHTEADVFVCLRAAGIGK